METKYNIGDTMHHFGVEIDYTRQTTKVTHSAHNVLGINEYRLVLDNSLFKRLSHSKSIYSSDTEINKVATSHFNFSNYNQICVNLYTLNKSESSARKRMFKSIEKFIKKNFGIYFGVGSQKLLDDVLSVEFVTEGE
jgi:hypothetical protein